MCVAALVTLRVLKLTTSMAPLGRHKKVIHKRLPCPANTGFAFSHFAALDCPFLL